MINSLNKKENLREIVSINYFYNCQKILTSNKNVLSTGEKFKELDISRMGKRYKKNYLAKLGKLF